MGYAWCFHDKNLSGSISFPHTLCCFTAFSCPEWEKSCFLLLASARELFSLSPSSPCKRRFGQQLPAGTGTASQCEEDGTTHSKKCSWLLLDPVSVRAEAQGSGSADTKRGSRCMLPRLKWLLAGGGGKLLQMRLKSEQALYCRGKNWVACWLRLPLKGPSSSASSGRGSDLVTFLLCG